MIRRSRLLPALAGALLLSAGLAGCPRRPEAGGPLPVPTQDDDARIEAVRAGAAALIRTQADLYWRAWALGEEVDLGATYAGREDLFSKETVAQVRGAREAARDPSERRALSYLEAYLVGEHVAMQIADLEERIAAVEASAMLTLDGEEIAYRDLGRLLAHEESRARRQALAAAALPVLNALAPLIDRKDARTREVVAQVGYPGYVELASHLRQLDANALARLAEQVLTSTERLYLPALERVARRELDVGRAEVRRSDIPRLFRASTLDERFPAAQAMPKLAALLDGLGLSVEAGGHVRIHDEPLPRKNPRAVCFPVSVPDDVRLSIKPVGGLTDYEALFHEMGHAQHFAATRTEVFEFRQLGSNAVSEAYAFLFEGLLGDPAFLTTDAGLTSADAARLSEVRALQRLYMVRRYAAKLLFELKWHRGDLDGHDEPAGLYAALLSRAYGFPLDDHDALRWRVDHDDLLYSADYLRAWFLEAQLESVLTRRFGARWWASREAGDYLQGLWRTGTRWSADDLARELGEKGLDPRPLVRELEVLLALPATPEA